MPRRKWMVAAVVLAGVMSLAPVVSAHNQQPAGRVTQKTQQRAALFPVTLKDDAGHTVTVRKMPHHIASVTEGTDEILSALVPKQDIALVTTAASDPAYSNVVSWAKGLPAIAEADAERILAVHPDLVLLASYTKPGVVDQIEQTGVPAYEFANFNSIADIERNIQVVGKLTGHEDKASAVVARMNNLLAQIARAVQQVSKGKPKPRVLDYSSWGYVAGAGTTVDDIITHAGAVNAAAGIKGWQKVTEEEIVKLNPDVIIVSSDEKGFVAKLLNDDALSGVRAIAHGRVYYIKSADLSSVSQYIVDGVRDVAHRLYPAAKLPQPW
ncbi:hemin receptor [Alicyclobacillus cellulosilyticus]|uniref:Hemin receptor n=1 Tax=Alicyclobacillus cellulosilyticus TaxID=1003997 RepID=A0A917K573_9BACL|nr:ABC transporter substrate-binding protein [Alicyclobacillus cellulosilyticus]GGI98592.1 hemin receptor [Alicyclobacillus cellulosilyticus]